MRGTRMYQFHSATIINVRVSFPGSIHKDCACAVDHLPISPRGQHSCDMSKKESRSSLETVAIGDCGYCGKSIHTDKNKALPLECQKCSELYHVSCLKGERPSVLLGDQLWLFRCAFCSPLGQETCTRPNLQW